jgi:hypothetical protein
MWTYINIYNIQISLQVIPQFLLCLHEGWFKCNHMG